MKANYPHLIAIGILFLLNESYAQKKATDYIVKDSAFSMGEVNRLSSESIEFKLTRNGEPIRYDAQEIMEYGYNGNVFESLTINGQQKFIKKITKGNVKFYEDNKQFILKTDTSLIFMTRSNFRSVISNSLCREDDSYISNLSYSKAALSSFVNDYYKGICNTENFPYRKLGVYFGYNFHQFNAVFSNPLLFKDKSFSSSLKIEEIHSHPFFGFFFDIPIYKPKSLFLSTELNWFRAEPTFKSNSLIGSKNLNISIRGANTMVSTKWLFHHEKLKSYVKTGAIMSFLNVSAKEGVFVALPNRTFVDISRDKISEGSQILVGLNCGLGIEIGNVRRKNYHTELRYSKTFDLSYDFFDLTFSGLSLLLGINI